MDHMEDHDGEAIGGESAGETAAARVRDIVDAAEATAAAIVSDAKAQADRHVQEARQAAERIRAQALAVAEEHLAAVEQATARLRSDIGSAAKEAVRGAEPAEPGAEPAATAAKSAATAAEHSADLDGARLVALNMALGGDSRAEIDRYLAEHFDLPQRAQLVDEVYAAVEA
jgi:cell division septum initiation protein DivIVA